MSGNFNHQRDGDRDHFIRDVWFAFALFVLCIYALWAAAAQLIPIVIAILIWFFINGIAHALRSIPVVRVILPKWLAVILASVVVGGVVVLAVRIVIDNFAELSNGVDNLPDRAARTVHQLEEMIGVSFDLDIARLIQEFKVGDYIKFSDTASAVIDNLSSIALVMLYVLFLLLDQPFYDAKIRALVPDPIKQQRVRAVLARIGADTRTYVWIMTIVSLGVGFFTYGIAVYFDLAGAAFWGFLAFALNYIPTIGSFLGILVPGTYALVQFDDLEQTVKFAIALGLVQFVMGNLLLPRIAGNRLNLSQFVVILSLTIWGVLWGAAGLFLAVPIMMVVTIVLSQLDSTRPLAILLSQNGRIDAD